MIILMSRVVTLHHKKTSMRLTDTEWNILDAVCKKEKIKRKILLERISENRDEGLNLTSAVRLFMLIYFSAKTPIIDCTESKKLCCTVCRILKDADKKTPDYRRSNSKNTGRRPSRTALR